ncbi:MAG: hypothetical protein K0S01_2674 [Herbinix sp.]|jgi:hypothetical protein|nr:hypothetical protein [Herbinix sp.]
MSRFSFDNHDFVRLLTRGAFCLSVISVADKVDCPLAGFLATYSIKGIDHSNSKGIK